MLSGLLANSWRLRNRQRDNHGLAAYGPNMYSHRANGSSIKIRLASGFVGAAD
jgi:hypothetical protein